MAAPERDVGPLSILEAIDGRPKRREPVGASQPPRRAAWVGGGLLALLLGGWGVSQWRAPDPAEPALPAVARSASAVAPAATASTVLAVAPAASTPALVEGLPQAAASAVQLAQQVAPASAAASAAAVAAADALPPVAALAAAAAATSLAAPAPAASAAAAKPHRKHKDKAADTATARAPSAGSKTDKTAVAAANPGKSSTAGHRDADVDLIAALMRHADPVAPAAGVAAAQSVRSSETSIAGLVARCKTLAGAEAKACRRRICDGYWGKAEACPARLAPKHSTTSP